MADEDVEHMVDFYAEPQVPFVCPRCGSTNYHPEHVAEGFCAHCSDWTAITLVIPPPS